MDLFDLLTMVGGLCLFLFGMNVMGDALERRAGGKLESILAKLTANKAAGIFTSNSKLFCYNGYGSGFCKLRTYDTQTGD